MNHHTIKRFEDELNDLKERILAMGGLVEKATKRSMNSLIKHDTVRAQKVIEREVDINDLELEIDDMTRTILALRQPAAIDLRFVMISIKIVTDLERMGDLAEGIAENMLETQNHPLIQVASLQNLYKLVLNQQGLVLDAFARNDIDAAVTCIIGDKEINKLYKAMQREHLTYMIEDPFQITAGLIASNVAKNLERIGDHVVNIAKMVIYMINGLDVRHQKIPAMMAMIEEHQQKR